LFKLFSLLQSKKDNDSTSHKVEMIRSTESMCEQVTRSHTQFWPLRRWKQKPFNNNQGLGSTNHRMHSCRHWGTKYKEVKESLSFHNVSSCGKETTKWWRSKIERKLYNTLLRSLHLLLSVNNFKRRSEILRFVFQENYSRIVI
jgi:hypothetical protein